MSLIEFNILGTIISLYFIWFSDIGVFKHLVKEYKKDTAIGIASGFMFLAFTLLFAFLAITVFHFILIILCLYLGLFMLTNRVSRLKDVPKAFKDKYFK